MKIYKLFLLPLLVASLAGCNNKPNKSTSDESSISSGSGSGSEGEQDYSYPGQDMSGRDVTYPTTVTPLSGDSIQIHYHRNDNKYQPWCLWLWDEKENNGAIFDFNFQDDFGVTASYLISDIGALSTGRIGFLVRDASWNKDVANDRYIDTNKIEKDSNNVYHAYLFSGDEHIYTTKNKTLYDEISTAEFADEENITLVCSNKISSYDLMKDNVSLVKKENLSSKRETIALPNNESAQLSSVYSIKVKFAASGKEMTESVSVSKLYNSETFNNEFYYDGELGAIYTSAKTTFKVWSPVSTDIKLRIYNSGTPTALSNEGSDTYEEKTMTRGEKGVWSVEVSGDLQGKYYTYVVTNSAFNAREIVDPYAKGAGINGARGMIVDFSRTNPTGWDAISPLTYDRNELTVWETHIADVTSSKTWTGSEDNRRKYLGVVEEGTTYTFKGTTVTTGFDHIKELGVNAVQLLPIFDQANDERTYTFNWGYNPLNYNVVEGLYSSDPYNGYARINELKTIIMKFNQAGISTIMDVVYNHVNAANGSNFDVLVPGYYYRYNADGSLSNGSGCGNETASNMPMMRKFMIDSTAFWASEYKLGGFRFDLMGLHDLTTMNNLVANLKTINPNIVVYGEPWTGGTSSMPNYESQSAKQSNGNKYVGYGQFNDRMRDALIKGGLNASTAQGWVTNKAAVNNNDVESIKKGIAGATYNNEVNIADPNKTVNYVTCHDNYTLSDRIEVSYGNDDMQDLIDMNLLANGVVFTSQGTTFMLAGDEFMRTKQYNSNSYESSDYINNLDYKLKVEYKQVFDNYVKLIAFKQNTAQLHDSTCTVQVNSKDGGSVLTYKLTSGTTEYIVIQSNGAGTKTAIDLTGYSVFYDSKNAATGALGSFTPSKLQTLIAIKD